MENRIHHTITDTQYTTLHYHLFSEGETHWERRFSFSCALYQYCTVHRAQPRNVMLILIVVRVVMRRVRDERAVVIEAEGERRIGRQKKQIQTILSCKFPQIN